MSKECAERAFHLAQVFGERLCRWCRIDLRQKELWYDLRTVYPDMGGNNRELGVMIQLCQDSDKIPTSADKTMMRLSMLNSYGSMSRDQKV